RRRARELEEYFDEELGPYVRLLLVHSILPDPRLTLLTFVPDATTFQYFRARALYPAIRRRFIEYMSITPSAVERAYEKIRAASTSWIIGWYASERSSYPSSSIFPARAANRRLRYSYMARIRSTVSSRVQSSPARMSICSIAALVAINRARISSSSSAPPSV